MTLSGSSGAETLTFSSENDRDLRRENGAEPHEECM